MQNDIQNKTKVTQEDDNIEKYNKLQSNADIIVCY